MGYTLGIDLGSTFTTAAIRRGDDAPEPLPLQGHSASVPSVVFVGADGTTLFGAEAEAQALAEPGRAARRYVDRIGDQQPFLLGGDTGQAVAAHAPDLAAAIVAWVVATAVRRENAA